MGSTNRSYLSFSSASFFLGGGQKDGGADLGGLGNECVFRVHNLKFLNNQKYCWKRKKERKMTWLLVREM